MQPLILAFALLFLQDEAVIEELYSQLQEAIQAFKDPQDSVQLPGADHWKRLLTSVERVISARPSRELETWNLFVGGMVALTSGNTGEAISEFARGAQYNPNEGALFHYSSGLAQTFQRQYPAAEAAFKAAIAVNPAWARPHSALAALYLDSGRLADAEHSVRKSIEFTGYDQAKARHYLLLAQVEHLQGRTSDALTSLGNAIVADPSDLFLRDYLALLRLSANDTDGAVAVWREAQELTGFPAARRNIELLENGVLPKDSGKVSAGLRGNLTGRDPALLSYFHYRTYTAQGKAGDTIRVRVESDDFRPFIALLSPRGKMVAAQDIRSSYFSYLEYTFPANGTYHLLVTSSTPLGTGEFVLSRQ